MALISIQNYYAVSFGSVDCNYCGLKFSTIHSCKVPIKLLAKFVPSICSNVTAAKRFLLDSF